MNKKLICPKCGKHCMTIKAKRTLVLNQLSKKKYQYEIPKCKNCGVKLHNDNGNMEFFCVAIYGFIAMMIRQSLISAVSVLCAFPLVGMLGYIVRMNSEFILD